MSKTNKKWVWSTSVMCVLLFLSFFPVSVVQVDIGDDSYWLEDERFVLSWIHSVEKEEWKEEYVVKKENFLLTKTALKAFGAGTPYNGGKTSIEDGFVVMEINEAYTELNIMISKNVKTTIEMNGEPIFLYQLIDEEFENAHFFIEKVPLWEFLRGESL